MNDRNKSTAHTAWNCKYHIVFAPKFRREILYNQKREIVGKILRKLCEWKDVEIIEAEVCPDHIHRLVSIPPKLPVSSFLGYLKGYAGGSLFTSLQIPFSTVIAREQPKQKIPSGRPGFFLDLKKLQTTERSPRRL